MMSIDSSQAPQGHKAIAVSGSPGKKAKQLDDVTGDGSSSFLAMMTTMLSVPESDGNASDVNVALSAPDSTGSTGSVTTMVPLNFSIQQPSSMDVLSPPMPLVGGVLQLSTPLDQSPAQEQAVKGTADLSVSGATKGNPVLLQSLKDGSFVDEKLSAAKELFQNVKPVGFSELADNTVVPNRIFTAFQSPNTHAQEVKDIKLAYITPSVTTLENEIAAVFTSAAEVLKPQDRTVTKSGFGQSGSTGFDTAFGQATASLNRTDALFVVPPASASVADTAVAETVSYWVSHGVQSAELTLDGLGESPVQVSISLNGDQAQIDFRTDHSGIRQILEGASTQLKDMLSGQGLQLSGMSVGTSGQSGDFGENPRHRPGTQQITLVKEDALNSVVVRAKHLSVGRSLDLFV
jgi:hypothetical protein